MQKQEYSEFKNATDWGIHPYRAGGRRGPQSDDPIRSS